jgi:hypothetical protein
MPCASRVAQDEGTNRGGIAQRAGGVVWGNA